MARILVVDRDPLTHQILADRLTPRGDTVELVQDRENALARLTDSQVDLVLVDRAEADADAESILNAAADAQIACLVVAAFGSVEDAVSAMRAGAADFVSKPFSAEQIELAVDRALERTTLVRQNRELRAALDDRLRLGNFVSSDPQMRETLETVRAVAPTRTTVLITGESGTGKTLLARAIHQASDRSDGPFIEVNCGALPENLLESELFGHVKGAFTGAVKDRPGKFESAEGGTIFLDEIGTATAGLQVKLLRILQERTLERVGDHRSIQVDVRVVLATNLDLAAAVREGTFREDLYYRIHVVPLRVPPLRERRGDVLPLAEHFLKRFATEHGKPVHSLSRAALQALEQAPWPGNVRQLENVLERGVVLATGESLDVEDLPRDLHSGPSLTPAESHVSPMSMLAPDAHLQPLKQALEAPERELIQRALEYFDGNRQRTAESLGINRSTLFNKMRKFGML